MTQEEREQLTRFLQLLGQAQAGPKDPEADAMIRDALARQPDAGYLLVQRVLQLEIALRDATQAQGARSFVGDANAWGRAPAAQPPAPAGPVPMQASRLQAGAQPPLQPAPQPAGAPAASTWGSGLFGTVASTAAGVVAGSLLAQGIGSLFGGHHANAAAGKDAAAVPPGGGTLVDTDYGAGTRDRGDDYVAEVFDPGDSGDAGGDSGGDVG